MEMKGVRMSVGQLKAKLAELIMGVMLKRGLAALVASPLLLTLIYEGSGYERIANEEGQKFGEYIMNKEADNGLRN